MSDFKKIGELKKDEEKPQLGVPKPQEVHFIFHLSIAFLFLFLFLFSPSLSLF